MRTVTLAAIALGLTFLAAHGATASGGCFASLASGTGPTALIVCLSDHGNVVQWTTPAGVEHSTKNEGYVLCSQGPLGPVVHGWDAGVSTESGFGPATIVQPNGPHTLPLSITRTTDDGVFAVEQQFSRDASEKDLTISMLVSNVGPVSRSGIRLARYFGMSPNRLNNSPDNASTTSDSVFLWDDPDQPFVNRPGLVYGVMLTALSYGVPHRAVVEDHDNWNPQDDDGPRRAATCSPLDVQSPAIDLLDLRGRLTYELGSLNPGRRSGVRFLYRHM